MPLRDDSGGSCAGAHSDLQVPAARVRSVHDDPPKVEAGDQTDLASFSCSQHGRGLPQHEPAHIYPPEAVKAGINGRVLLRVHIDATGTPTQVEIERSSGNVPMDRAAMEAARRWSFNPAYADGEPIPARVLVPVDFRLD